MNEPGARVLAQDANTGNIGKIVPFLHKRMGSASVSFAFPPALLASRCNPRSLASKGSRSHAEKEP